MKKFITFIMILMLAVTFNNVYAQDSSQIRVGTGGSTGTYSRMFKEMIGQCAGNYVYVEQNSSGSLENIDNLLQNKINAAFVQTDVLFLKANTEDMGMIKTLLALHPEEVHFIAKGDTGLKSGGVWGFGGKQVVFNTINDLEGYKVGAVGGSLITAQVIRLQSEISFQIVQFDKNEVMLDALQKNEIQCAIMVGGSPMAAVEQLGPEYKLLSVPEATAGKLKNVYRPARLTYRKMGANGVNTVATDALLVTREYKLPRYILPLLNLRKCTLDNLVELQETTGKHPKWVEVKPDNKGKWSGWYEAPNGVTLPKKQ